MSGTETFEAKRLRLKAIREAATANHQKGTKQTSPPEMIEIPVPDEMQDKDLNRKGEIVGIVRLENLALQEQVDSQKAAIAELQATLKTKAWALPSRKDIVAWCEKHPEDADAISIVKAAHSWWGPIQTALAVMAKMRQEGGT